MIRRLMICCLSLSLLLTGCGQQEIALVPPQRDGVFRAELWEEERPDIQASLSPVDIVDTTFSHTDPGEEIARLLGGALIVYPQYARELEPGYAEHQSEEYRLLTALLNTDGTTVGITPGANTQNARYIARTIGDGQQFITREQVEYAARYYFGEEVELHHQSVPVSAPEEEQFLNYEEYGVYAYPEKRPIWYVPLLLDLEEISFNTVRATIVFVRYADSSQNAFWGLDTRPVARWEMEEYANYHLEDYQVYTAVLKEMFGQWQLEEVAPAEAV